MIPQKPLKTQSKHDYVVPMNTYSHVPSYSLRTRMIRSNMSYKRISFPSSIKEENEEEEERREQKQDDDEDNIPLAILAYKKGLVVPDKLNTFVKHRTTQREQRPYYKYPTLHYKDSPSELPQFYHSRNHSISSLSSSSTDTPPLTPRH